MTEQEHKVAHTCKTRIYPAGMMTSFPCGVRASVERDGTWFCKRHDPIARAEKRAKRDAEYDKKWAGERKRRQIERAAPDLLAACEEQLALARKRKLVSPDIDRLRAAISRATTQPITKD